MAEYLIDGLITVQPKFAEAGKEIMQLINEGKAVELIVQEYDEKATQRRRSNDQNRMIYKIYQRISKTLHGSDESFTRRECKLKYGCRILRRDSYDFSGVYDLVIRTLNYEDKLLAMDLISVSGIMSMKQGSEYIKRLLADYTLQGCYFGDIDGTEDYMQSNYPEVNK